MDPELRRRLDVLIVICSWLLGIVLTYLFYSEKAGTFFILSTLVPTAVLALLAMSYVIESNATSDDEHSGS